jgi:hypothetical protein
MLSKFPILYIYVLGDTCKWEILTYSLRLGFEGYSLVGLTVSYIDLITRLSLETLSSLSSVGNLRSQPAYD